MIVHASEKVIIGCSEKEVLKFSFALLKICGGPVAEGLRNGEVL